MGRKKSGAVSGIAGLAILCVASLVLFTIYVKEDEQTGPLHTVQLGAAEVLRPVRGLITFIGSPISSARDSMGSAFNAQEEEELQRKAREYEADAAEAARLRQENQRLRELLGGQQPSFEYAPLARVVAPVGGQLTKRLQINVGSDDGVGPEQPVVVGENILVGRTTQSITPHTAEVILVTSQDFAAGVRMVPPEAPAEPLEGEAPYGQGLLQTSWEGYLGVDLVDLNARVEKGDFVVTSGRSEDRRSIYPPGLLVGTVESVSSQDINQFQNITVTPAVRPGDLQEVRVITGW
ncbi:MAG: hypothetical protein CYG60_05840 [Actinobacteria bacterium]|nr:MAG: hypothetical protein CYG60_05840 [Actinomycetota bacterium]